MDPGDPAYQVAPDPEYLARLHGPEATPAEKAYNISASFINALARTTSSLSKSVSVAAKALANLFPDGWLPEQDKDVQELAFYKYGQALEDFVDKALPRDPRFRETFITKLSEGFGSTAGFVMSGAAGRVLKVPALLTVAGAGAAVGTTAEFEQAIAAGATEDQAIKAAAWGGLVGTSEALPISRIFRRFDKASGGQFSMTAKRLLAEGFKGGFEEMVQEVFQGASGNVIAKNIYDNERKLLDGLVEGGGIGGIVGTTANIIATAAGARLRHGRKVRRTPTGKDVEAFIEDPSRKNAGKLGVPRRTRDSAKKRKEMVEQLKAAQVPGIVGPIETKPKGEPDALSEAKAETKAPTKTEAEKVRKGLKAAEDAVIEQLGGAVEPDLFGPGQFGSEIGGTAGVSFVKGEPSEALAKAVGEEILRKTGWKKLPPGLVHTSKTSDVEDVLSDIKDQGYANPESTLADIIISNREAGSRAATLRNIEGLPEEQIGPEARAAIETLRQAREGAPDALGNFLSPGEPIDAMGATDNPNYEVAPDGMFRRKVRSAADLVGDEQPVGAKSAYASPNLEFESRYQKARHGLQKRTLANKMRQFWDFMGKITHRGALPELPRTRQFGEARSAAQAFKNAPAIAVRTVEEVLARTLKPLSSKDYDLFGRSVLFADLIETDGALPFGLDAKSAATEAKRIAALVESNPRVQAAIEFRGEWMEKMKADYIDAHKAIGVDFSDRFTRQNYFRHQVLYWANLKEIGKVALGGPPRMRTDRGWLKKRQGSVLDINANYIQAEWEVATQMVSDTWRAKAWARIQKQYDIRPELLKTAKAAREAGDQNADWRDFVPETHDEYQFRPGRSVHMAPTVQETVAQRLFEAAGEQIGLTIEDIRRIPALGSEFKPVVLPVEITKQLAAMEQVKDPGLLGMIDKIITVPMKYWKTMMLQSPRRATPYNLRNASEVDKVAVVNPTFVFEIDQAVRDLWKMYRRSEDTPAEMLEWANRGGANSLVRVNELARVDELGRFERLLDKTPKSVLAKAGNVPGQAWRLYWDTVGLATDFRESILRYAVYRDYLKQIQSSKDGKTPRNFGASNPEEIRGIVDPRDKAFRLSADLLIDYSDISVLGQFIRERAYPFWSFQEGNARAYLQATKNIASNDAAATKVGAKIARLVGGKALFMGPALLMKLGKIGILYAAFQALLASVNRFLYPDEDDELPKGAREKAHVTLGRDDDGRVRYFSRLGTAGDFLEWFGADGAFYDFRDVMDGRRSIRDIAIDYAKSPLNKVSSGISPFIKVPFEVATKRSTFPDVTKPGRIRDRAEHLFRSLALDKEYRALSGKPMREGFGEGLLTSWFKKVDPGSSAYYRILDEKRRFRAAKGLGFGYSDSERSQALFNYKQAIRFDDKAAATRYLSVYMGLGGTKDGLQRSLDFMHPLGGLSRADKREFVEGLREEDRLLLDKATQFYRETLNPRGSPGSKERIPGMAHRLGTIRPKDRDKRTDWSDRQADAIEWFKYQGFSMRQIRLEYRKYLRKRYKTAKTRRAYMRRFNRSARKIGR